jgi:hypothetical protein
MSGTGSDHSLPPPEGSRVTDPDAGQPPPGWYPEPSAPGAQRYWDGRRWTEHLAPLPTPPAGSSSRTAIWVASIIGVVLLALGGMTVWMFTSIFSSVGSVFDGFLDEVGDQFAAEQAARDVVMAVGRDHRDGVVLGWCDDPAAGDTQNDFFAALDERIGELGPVTDAEVVQVMARADLGQGEVLFETWHDTERASWQGTLRHVDGRWVMCGIRPAPDRAGPADPAEGTSA